MAEQIAAWLVLTTEQRQELTALPIAPSNYRMHAHRRARRERAPARL